MTRRGRRWLRLLTGFFFTGVVLYLLIPMFASTLVRWRLQAMIARQLDARLDIGKLIYHAPYGVTVIDASLETAGPDGRPLELLRMPRLDLQLARRPWASGPLLIESIVLENPSVHLIHTDNGLVGRRTLVRTTSPEDQSKAPRKLSEILRLTRFALQGGSIEYDDVAHAGALPLVWKNINVNLKTSRVSEGGYAYHLDVDNEPLARMETSGVADLDKLAIRVTQCALVVHVDPSAQESPLSAELQEPLRKWRARGVLTINTSGSLSLLHPASSIYHSTVELTQASARVPGWLTALDRVGLKIELTDGSEQTVTGKARFAPGEHPTARIDLLEAKAGDAVFRLNHAVAVADAVAKTWKLIGLSGHLDPGVRRSELPALIQAILDRLKIHGAVDFALDANGPFGSYDPGRYTGQLAVTPVDLSVQPPGFDNPVAGITPLVVHLSDGLMTAEALRGASDGNLLYLKQVRLSLKDFGLSAKAADGSLESTTGWGMSGRR